MGKCLKKYSFRVLIVLLVLFFAGGIIMYFNSLKTLTKYKNVQFHADMDGEKYIFQNGYAYKRPNIPVQIYLSGSHYEMGLQYGVLLKDEIRQMTKSLSKVIVYYSEEMKIPKELVYIYFKFNINRLSHNVPDKYKDEMKGISDGSGVDLNAIYAISLFDDMVHSMGCTSITALSEDKTILHGRNEDLYLGMELGMKQAIVQYNPTGYNSYVSISFPGFVGVSTGYNSKGLGYSHNSRYANGPNYKGYPQHTISRMALEECSSLQEVIDFYKGKSVTIGDAHTWSDRNNSTACIIEAAPDKTNPTKVIQMDKSVLWHINKYMDPNYAKNNEDKYNGEDVFNTAREEIFKNLVDEDKTVSLDNMISLLREEKGKAGENYNFSGIARGICNVDTQLMAIFDPKGKGMYFAYNNYFASKSTIYFIPENFEESPYVYKEKEEIDQVLQDIAIIKESMLSKSDIIKRLKELIEKYPDQGNIYFMLAQTFFDTQDLAGWADNIEQAYKLKTLYDTQDLSLEKAKVEFYKQNMKLTEQLLADISYKDLKSYKSKAQFLYLYKMYYEAIDNRAEANVYEGKFQELVSDKKNQKKIIRQMEILKN